MILEEIFGEGFSRAVLAIHVSEISRSVVQNKFPGHWRQPSLSQFDREHGKRSLSSPSTP